MVLIYEENHVTALMWVTVDHSVGLLHLGYSLLGVGLQWGSNSGASLAEGNINDGDYLIRAMI